MSLNLRSSDSRFTWVETTSPLKAVPGIILDCRHWVWGEVKDVRLASSAQRPGIWCARWPPGTENDLAQMSAVLRLTNHPPELLPLAEEIYKEPPNTLVNQLFLGSRPVQGRGRGKRHSFTDSDRHPRFQGATEGPPPMLTAFPTLSLLDTHLWVSCSLMTFS